ncbi:MAG: FkbM family methyltransferase [Candidatus Moraniibacteriota bacterium]|nr:MAG: FkbM family methyltransferase [Candidatus Moranbacteria bacterium]
MLIQKLTTLKQRPDFQRNPCKAVWRRILWHTRWKCISHPWAITLRNEIKISVPRSGTGALIYYQGESEPLTNRFLRSFLRPGMSFWDVGAHIGEHTLLAACAVGATGEIHAFEPSPATFALLTANVESNGLTTVTLNQQAVSDSCKQMTFQVFGEPAISCLTPRMEDDRRYKSKQIHVACTALDHYSNGRRIPNLIKIDVEGAELSVFDGMVSLLALEPGHAPTLIFEFCRTNTERFGYQPKRLITLLNAHGFMLYYLSKSGLVPIDFEADSDHYPENNLIAAKIRPCTYSV